MRKINPFPYSDDNKRYQTWNYYLRQKFNQKVFKVPLNAGFTCPNRDGFLAYGGCTFCSALGSGEFAGTTTLDLLQQYQQGRMRMEQKWPNAKTIPYFQSFTNTYGSLNKIKACLEPFLHRDEVCAIALATRADCLSDECIEFLQACSHQKEIWIELGLQSYHNKTALAINRCHTWQQFTKAIERLQNTSIQICVHLMNGLPNESVAMMIETANQISQLKIQAVKIHMLHLIQDTVMTKNYKKQPFPLLSQEEYVDLVVRQLEILPQHFIIQRLTGDGIAEELVEPKWTMKKTIVINEIDKLMALKNTWQGKSVNKFTK